MFPVRVVNNSLQGKFEDAGIELARFGINVTMGVGGLFDVASTNFNIAPREQDFGLTLGHWGAGNGAYIVLPVFGPCTVRDTFGRAGDAGLNPTFYIPWWAASLGTSVGTQINTVSLRLGKYEDLKKSAVDPYVALRDAYIKYRADQLSKQ
jgi:phospholipid-binding lipoprotein MlaA